MNNFYANTKMFWVVLSSVSKSLDDKCKLGTILLARWRFFTKLRGFVLQKPFILGTARDVIILLIHYLRFACPIQKRNWTDTAVHISFKTSPMLRHIRAVNKSNIMATPTQTAKGDVTQAGASVGLAVIPVCNKPPAYSQHPTKLATAAHIR